MKHPAVHHISKADPIMGRLVRAVGAYALEPEGSRPPFQALVQAVAHQQLNGTAANTILKRFIALFPGRKFPKPEDLASVTDIQIRKAGFSGAKVASIRDIAAKTIEGVVPSSRRIMAMEDEEIVERLTTVRGVGRWTVEMLLIFKLGRPDVLPANDFGVRSGFRLTYKLKELPTPKDILAHGECWRPHRTAAAWYLWRAVELGKK
jgi:DNA-3-methyladenine glycosylase II